MKRFKNIIKSDDYSIIESYFYNNKVNSKKRNIIIDKLMDILSEEDLLIFLSKYHRRLDLYDKAKLIDYIKMTDNLLIKNICIMNYDKISKEQENKLVLEIIETNDLEVIKRFLKMIKNISNDNAMLLINRYNDIVDKYASSDEKKENYKKSFFVNAYSNLPFDYRKKFIDSCIQKNDFKSIEFYIRNICLSYEEIQNIKEKTSGLFFYDSNKILRRNENDYKKKNKKK